MQLPPQKRFTLQDLAIRWDRPVHYVEEMVRDKQFEYIIIEWIDGAQPTHLVYFDGTLYYKHTRKQHEHKRAASIKSLRTTRTNKSNRELLKRWAELDQDSLDEILGEGKVCMIPEDKRGFPPSCTLTPNVYPDIHKPLLAILWSPEKPQKPYEPPNGARIFIPQSSVEPFEQKAGNQTTPNGSAWVEAARTFAKELRKRHKSQNQDWLAREVREKMCQANQEGKTGMTGRSGRVPSQGSIRRRALKGI